MDNQIEDFLIGFRENIEIIKEYGYEGEISKVLRNLLKFDWSNLNNTDKFYIIPKTSLLLRVAVNFKIEQNDEQSYRLMLCVRNLCQLIIHHIIFKEGPVERIIDSLNYLAEHTEFRRKTIQLESDSLSCKSLEGDRIIKSLLKLDEISSGSNLILTVIGGGGFISGLYLFTLAQQFGVIGQESILYPIRYSRMKSSDYTPKINQFDIDFINSNPDMKIVTYEDDSSTGDTIFNFARYLAEQFNRHIYLVCGNPSNEKNNPNGILFLEKLANTPQLLSYSEWRTMQMINETWH